MEGAEKFANGDVVLLRSVYRGRVRWTFPHRVVATAPLRALGVFDDAAAAEVRAEGERVIAAWPFPTGWEDWRPDPAWTPPELPEDWHVVD
ncbi:MAG TPA: hypothetical protein VLN26_16905 [Gaiellaceae bacterium]|nr:hypothetical protein [Gaiellaceae bacterium]